MQGKRVQNGSPMQEGTPTQNERQKKVQMKKDEVVV